MSPSSTPRSCTVALLAKRNRYHKNIVERSAWASTASRTPKADAAWELRWMLLKHSAEGHQYPCLQEPKHPSVVRLEEPKYPSRQLRRLAEADGAAWSESVPESAPVRRRPLEDCRRAPPLPELPAQGDCLGCKLTLAGRGARSGTTTRRPSLRAGTLQKNEGRGRGQAQVPVQTTTSQRLMNCSGSLPVRTTTFGEAKMTST